MNHKPFNLSKFQAGAVAVTRDGRKVRYVGMMPEDHDWNCPVVGVVETDEEPYTWCLDGYYSHGSSSHCNDLFMMPEKVEGWVNVYSGSSWSHFDTKQDADRFALDDRIACLQISYTEGEGLESEPQSKEG